MPFLRRLQLVGVIVSSVFFVALAQNSVRDQDTLSFESVWNSDPGAEATVVTRVSTSLEAPGDGASSTLTLVFETGIRRVAQSADAAAAYTSYLSEIDVTIVVPVGYAVGSATMEGFDLADGVWVPLRGVTAMPVTPGAGGVDEAARFAWRIEEEPTLDLARLAGLDADPVFRVRLVAEVERHASSLADDRSAVVVQTAFSERHFKYLRRPDGAFELSEQGTFVTRRSGTLAVATDATAATNVTAVDVVGVASPSFDTNGGSFEITVSPRTADGSMATGAFAPNDFSFRNIRVVPRGSAASDPPVALGEVDAVRVDSVPAVEATDVSIVLVLDSSGSMDDNDPRRERVEAAQLLLESLAPGVRGAVMDFGAGVSGGRRASRLLQGFTTDREALRRALERVAAAGGTPLYAAVLDALDLLADEASSQRAVVALSDGRANSDDVEVGVVRSRANELGVTVFSLGLGRGLDFGELQGLAVGTGGTFGEADDASRLATVFAGFGQAIREGRVLVTARGRLDPPLAQPGLYVLTGEMITVHGPQRFVTPFTVTLDVSAAREATLPLWIGIPRPGGGVVDVHSDLPPSRAQPLNLQGLAGTTASFEVFDGGVRLTDQGDVRAFVALLLDTLNRRGFVVNNRAHSLVRETAGAPRRRASDTPYLVPHIPISPRGTAYVFQGGWGGLPGIEARGLDNTRLRRDMWRDVILSVVFQSEFADELDAAQRARYEAEQQRTLRTVLGRASQSLSEGSGGLAQVTSGTLDRLLFASEFLPAIDHLLGRPAVVDTVARALDSAYVSFVIWGNHGQTTIGMFTGAPQYTFFQRMAGHVGQVGTGLGIAAAVAKLTSDGAEALGAILAANAAAELRLNDLERLAALGPCRPDRRDDPAFCDALRDARAEFDALQRNFAEAIVDAFSSGEDLIDYAAITNTLLALYARNAHWGVGARLRLAQSGAVILTYDQFMSISDEGQMLRRAHLLAQLDHWLATDGEVPDPRAQSRSGGCGGLFGTTQPDVRSLRSTMYASPTWLGSKNLPGLVPMMTLRPSPLTSTDAPKP
jgi:Mg-chelatase subunit ChlD